MSHPGVGAVSDFLQTDGLSSSWATPAGGAATGGGLGVTVASGIATADYPSINDAVTSGNTIISVIGNTDELSNIDVGLSGLNISVFNSAIIDMRTNKFLWSASDNLEIEGNGKIIFAFASDDVLFDVVGGVGHARVAGLDIGNNSTASGILMNSTGGRLSNATVEGDLVLNGPRNIVSHCDMGSGLVLLSLADNNLVTSSMLVGAITDEGSGNIIADILTA